GPRSDALARQLHPAASPDAPNVSGRAPSTPSSVGADPPVSSSSGSAGSLPPWPSPVSAGEPSSTGPPDSPPEAPSSPPGAAVGSSATTTRAPGYASSITGTASVMKPSSETSSIAAPSPTPSRTKRPAS